jgi:hypothetical protein
VATKRMDYGIMFEEEPVTRARYLMSPYNLREARRNRSNKHIVISFIFVLTLLASICLIFL